MKRKLIALILLVCGYSLAQGPYESLSVDTNSGAISPSNPSIFAPSYAGLEIIDDPFIVASNAIPIANVTTNSGSITNTWNDNQSYLVFDVTSTWQVDLEYLNISRCPFQFNFAGYYDGKVADTVKFKAFDYTNGVYTNITAITDDLPSGTAESTLYLTLPGNQQQLCSNGYSRIAITGSCGGVTEQLYIDYTYLTYATLILTNSGEYIKMTGAQLDVTNNIGVDASAADVTTLTAGDYLVSWYLAFTGMTNTTFTIEHRTNGVASGARSIRSIGSSSSIGSMSAYSIHSQSAHSTNSWWLKPDKPNAWFTIVNGHSIVEKKSN